MEKKSKLWTSLFIVLVLVASCAPKPEFQPQFNGIVFAGSIPVAGQIPIATNRPHEIPWTANGEKEIKTATSNQTQAIPASFDGQVLPDYFSDGVKYFWCLGKIQYWADDAHQKYNVSAATKAEFRLGLATLIQIESCGYVYARSPSDARGLGQVMPYHFTRINPNVTAEQTYDPDTNLERASWHFSEEGVNKAAAQGYAGFEALVQASRGYNGGAGIIGKPSNSSETDRYETYFRAFMTGNMKVINNWYNAVHLYDGNLDQKAKEWLQTQPTCQQTATTSEQKLDQFVGVRYKDFGYLNNDGQPCSYKGDSPQVDNVPGLNCAGFVLEAVRTIYKPVNLEQIFPERSDRFDPSGADRLWFGYDEVMNLTDLIAGQIFKVEELDWEEGAGFNVADWDKLSYYLQKGFFYLASISKPNTVAGRMHHHVCVILPTETGVWVYEATSYEGSGVLKISLEEFQKKYLKLNPEYRMLVTQTKLP